MTVLSLADQTTVRFDSKLPAASRRSARNVTLSPTARVAVAGTTVTVATGGGGTTVTVAWPVLPSLVARSVAVPGPLARTLTELPDELVIDNTDGSVLDHDTARLPRALPAASLKSAVKTGVSPTVRLALPGWTVTVATGGGAATLTFA